MNDKTKLAYLAWKLESNLDVQRNSIKNPLDDSDWMKTYNKGRKHVVDETHSLAKEILELANKIRNEQFYMVEDVDLTGTEHIGQVVDKYA